MALQQRLLVLSPGTICWTVTEAEDRSATVERLRVLAPEEDRDAVVGLLHERQFRMIALASWCRTPGADDWYGVDSRDGTLLHVCLQRRLVLGSATRGWLPIERDRGVSGAPAGEPRATSLALALCERTLRGERDPLPEGPDAADRGGALRTAFGALFDSTSAEPLLDAAVDSDAVTLRRRLLAMTPDRTRGERIRELARHGRCRLAALDRRGLQLPLRARRERTGPALVIAVIGSDGSGKSTVSRWLAETLDAAFGARFLYFGTGDGPGSPIRRILNALKRRSRFGAAPAPAVRHDSTTAPRSAAETAPTSLRLVWATVVAWERVGKMRRLERARRRRFVVVTDRYPQNEKPGIHDGPRLDYLLVERTVGPGAALARVERSLYDWLARRVPDRVLLLDVPLELARRRRPEEPEDALARRIAVARSLRHGDAPRLVVDAGEPLGSVKARALRTALAALSQDTASPRCRDRNRVSDVRSRV